MIIVSRARPRRRPMKQGRNASRACRNRTWKESQTRGVCKSIQTKRFLLLFDWIIRHGLWHHVGRWDGGSISSHSDLVGQSKTVRRPWAPRPVCRNTADISSDDDDIYLTLLSPDRLICPQDYGIMGAVGGAAPPGDLPKRKKTSRPNGREVFRIAGASLRLGEIGRGDFAFESLDDAVEVCG